MNEKLERLLSYEPTPYVIRLPARFRECSFNNFDWADQNPKTWETILDFVEDRLVDANGMPKGLYFYGPFGVGKSHLLSSLYRVMVHKFGEVCEMEYISFADLISEIKARFGPNGNASEFEIEMKEKDYLFLDDITAIRLTDYAAEVFDRFVQYRYDHGKRMLITAQSPLSKLSVDDHARSRLFEMCVLLEIKGQDKRLG